MVGRWVEYLRSERQNKPATIAARAQAVRNFYEHINRTVVPADPVDIPEALSYPFEHRPRTTSLVATPAEIRLMLQTAEQVSAKDCAAIALMALVGMHASELCRARVADLRGDRLTIRRHDGTTDDVTVSVEVAESWDRAVAGRTEGSLLLRRDGTSLSRRSVERIVRRIAKAAGCADGICARSLRHAYIRQHLALGHSPHTVADMARLKTTDMVRRHRRALIDDSQARVTTRYP
jgi:integrase/recombinase XerD